MAISTEFTAPAGVAVPTALLDKFAQSALIHHRDCGDTGAAERAVRQHLRLAAHRQPGEELVRYQPPDDDDRGHGALLIVTDDMPLLVDALSVAITAAGMAIAQILHPVVAVARDGDGALVDVEPAGSAPPTMESWIRVDLESEPSASLRAEMVDSVSHTMRTLRQVNSDTAAMVARQISAATRLSSAAESGQTSWRAEELADAAALLHWLRAGNFSLLGYHYLPANNETARARTDRLGVFQNGYADMQLDAPIIAQAHSAVPTVMPTLETHPLCTSATPHLVAVPDIVDGGLAGEHRFLGLFTVTAMHANVLDIPVVAGRARTVIDAAGYRLQSHSGQALLDIIQNYPRPDLFTVDSDSLYRTVVSVLGSENRVLLFLRPHADRRALAALVYLPRDRYTRAVGDAIQDVLTEELGAASIERTVRVNESPLALVHFRILLDNPIRITDSDWNAVQQRLQQTLTVVCRSWDDDLSDALESEGHLSGPVISHYARYLPDSYKQDFSPRHAASDIGRIEALTARGVDVEFYAHHRAADHTELRFTLYVAGDRVSLSEVLPILHSLGVEVLDERPYRVPRPDGLATWIYDFGLDHRQALTALSAGGADAQRLARRFCNTFLAAWQMTVDVDAFNALVLRAGLTCDEAALLRAYAKYLRQNGFPYSCERISAVLIEHPQTCAALVELFGSLFDPDHADAAATQRLIADINTAIDRTVGLEADRILRAYLDLILATLRTNYYRLRADTLHSGALALKFDPRTLTQLPAPRPRFEIFVYSPRVEGVHLRYGAVARGGLRWSDRPEDFRTEVLGLVKAQSVKNSVIVPVGAKGGFVAKKPPAATGDPTVDRDAHRAEGVACYRTFVGALLDLTDNIDPRTGAIVAPPYMIRRDSDDPYLVVAADKGTATFSDEANAVAAEYHFWLGDAFASGGSVGYDHKAMGITAKGAWESVKRHFAELGVDIHRQDFTVVGIGDMSGDVFGNGMLLSEHIRLVAAFDHRHIFIDPTPDAATSYTERRRLFALSRSSWGDYNRELISAGGGIFERTVKSIAVSAQIRQALGLSDHIESLTPDELITAILRAPVDLLWNGGIGTYIKASTETHLAVGDKVNDPVRVDADTMRARVVGEGGNLGITALGRVEFAQHGGRINTDALDNSAGVNCSDHEVNIKILLDGLVSVGRIDPATRSELLREMTGDVERLVLSRNVAHNELLGTSRSAAADRIAVHARQIRTLVADRGLDRSLEALPDEAEISRRTQHGLGLTSPELATLTAHVKLALKDDILGSELPDGAVFNDRLERYFPSPLRRDFSDAIAAHRLRREIIATAVANDVVDTGGISYVFRLGEDTGASSIDAVRAYTAASAIVGLPAMVDRVRTAAPNTAVFDAMMTELRRLLDRVSRWLLTNRPQPLAVAAEIARYRDAAQYLMPNIARWLQGPDAEDVQTRSQSLVGLGADPGHATEVISLLHAYCALDIADIADMEGRDLTEVAELYYTLNAHLGIDHLLTAISGLDDAEHWTSLARLALRNDVYGAMRLLCVDVLSGSCSAESAVEKIADWEKTNAARLARARAILAKTFTATPTSIATLTVAAHQVHAMVRQLRPA